MEVVIYCLYELIVSMEIKPPSFHGNLFLNKIILLGK